MVKCYRKSIWWFEVRVYKVRPNRFRNIEKARIIFPLDFPSSD